MSEREKVIWELDFKISPVPSWDEEVEGFIFKKDDENVKARIEYFIDRYPKRGDAYLLTVPEDEASKCLKGFILLKAIHNGCYEPIIIKMENYKLLNREKLKTDGCNTRILREQSQQIACSSLYGNDCFSDAINYWSNGFQGGMYNFKDDAIRIAELVSKSKEETDEHRRFIMLYTAFNHLYVNFSEKICPLSERSRHTGPEIENVVNKLLTDKDCAELYKINKTLIDELTELNIYDKKGNNLSCELKIAVDGKKGEKEIVNIVFKCIWKIRNEIFHYSIGATDINKKAEIARIIIQNLMSIGMRNYVSYRMD